MTEYIQIEKTAGLERFNALKMTVDYELGGYNYFSGQRNRRGVYFYLKPVTRGNGMEQSIMLGGDHESGFKICLEELPRKNAKKMEAWFIKLKPLFGQIAELYKNKKRSEILQLVTTGSYEPVKYAIIVEATGEFYPDAAYDDKDRAEAKITYLHDYQVKNNMPIKKYVLEALTPERAKQHAEEWQQFVKMID